MLRFFKSNSIGIVFFLPILAIVLWSDILGFGSDNFVPLPYSMPAYAWISNFLTNATVSGIIALVLIILQAFYLVYINVVYNFISQRTYLTSLLFVLISSAFLNLHYLHPAIIANIFVLFTIVQIFSSYRKPKIYTESFNSGFFIAIAGLFYINANFLILFVFISLWILHSFNWREWMSVILGFATPYLITLFLYFYFDKWEDVIYLMDAIIQYESSKLAWPLPYYIFTVLLFIVGLFSIVKLSSTYSNNKVSTRSYFTLFTILLVFILAIFIFAPFASIELIVLMATPLSYIMANYFLSKGNKWVQEIAFVSLILSFAFFYIQKYLELGT
jgi:hypothetical protein